MDYLKVSGFLIGIYLAMGISYACITNDEISAINNISTATNTSNSTLLQLFEGLCSLKNTIYTKNETLSFINNSLLLANSTTSQINSTLLIEMEKWKALTNNFTIKYVEAYNSSLDSRANEFGEILDRKLAELKRYGVSKDELNETKLEVNRTINYFAEQLSNATLGYVNSKTSVWRMGGYGFVLLSVTIVLVAYLYTHKPSFFKPWLTGIKTEKNTLQDMITQSAFKKKQDMMRELKYKAVNSPHHYREELFRKIENGVIENEDELNQEIEILKKKEGKDGANGRRRRTGKQ